MPSAALQSRISAFESLGSPGASSSSSTFSRKLQTPFSPPITPRLSPSLSPSPSPPNLGHRTSLIDLKDWIVDDGPSPPRTNGSNHMNGSGNGKGHTQRDTDTKPLMAPLINLESPPKPKPLFFGTKAPPLPPRKPSFPSLKSAASSGSNNGRPSLPPPNRSDSLTVEHVHTYPPLKTDPSRPRNGPGHAPGSSISSFHSVSLSSDTDPSTPGSDANFVATYPIDQDRDRDFSINSNSSEADSISLGESYEEVSISSLASPATERMITRDWDRAMVGRVPPKLPQRPVTLPSSTALKSFIKRPPPALLQQAPAYGPHRSRPPVSSSPSPAPEIAIPKRRPPPPPPTSRSSDRSSIRSNATSRSTSSTYSKIDHPWSLSPLHVKTKRPTPVPPAARKRYEGVFNANIVQQRKAEKQRAKEKPALLSPSEARGTRRAAGWRGLSVDLIMAEPDADVSIPRKEDEEEIDEVVGASDRLEGCYVRSIWVQSKLDREKLSEIWNECDAGRTGTLDRDGFVSGMWRIDEELRRARTYTVRSASAGSLRGRSGHKLSHKSKPILR